MKVCFGVFISAVIFCLRYSAEAREWAGPVTAPFSRKTYYVSMKKADKNTAESICNNNDWILATVKNRAQQLIIKNLAIVDNRYNMDDDIWIGLTLSIDQKRGTWSDGTEISVPNSGSSYSNWTANEPQSRSICVQLWKREFYTWDDVDCDEKRRFACEGKAASSPNDVQRKAERIINKISTLPGNKVNAELVSLSVNELLNANEEYFGSSPNTSWTVVKTVDEFLDRYNRTESGNFKIEMPNLEMHVLRGRNKPITLQANKAEHGNDINIILTQKLLVEAKQRNKLQHNEQGDVQVNSVMYKKTSLFQVNKDLYKPLQEPNDTASVTFARNLTTPAFGDDPVFKLQPRVLTSVLSAAIKNVKMSSLNYPVCITMPKISKNYSVPELMNKKPKRRVSCAYWDFKINDWSTEGCVTYASTSSGSNACNISVGNERDIVVCKCNHMTHFSVLLDVTYFYAPRYLTDMTITGCALSIACLLATIVTILLFKQLRSKTPQQILLNLCINLLVVNLLFVIGIDRVSNKTFCKATSVMLHYFLLAAWAWMLVEAVFLALSLVLSRYSGGVRGKIVQISAILAYGVPAIIVGTTAGVAGLSAYTNEKYCWLTKDILIKTLVVPIAIILSINTMIFCLVIYSITCKSKMFRKNINVEKLRQTLRRACAMLFILGIPWIFGYLMLLSQNDQQKLIFAITFTIINTSQGVAIFVLFCVRQEHVRKLWLRPLGTRVRNSIRKIRPVAVVEKYEKRNESETKETGKSNTNNTKTIHLDDTKTTKGSTENLDQTKERVVESKPFRSGWV